MFPVAFISGLRDFMLHFNCRYSAGAIFAGDFDYFADMYILVMVWMGYVCVRN